jgi:hypothetical protein
LFWDLSYAGAEHIEVVIEQLYDETDQLQKKQNPAVYHGPKGSTLQITIALEEGDAKVNCI